MRSAKRSPRSRLKMYAVEQEAVDYIDLLQPKSRGKSCSKTQREQGQGSSAENGEGGQRRQSQQKRRFRRQRSEGDADRGRKGEGDGVVDGPEGSAIDKSTDDGALSGRGNRQQLRYRIRTRFPRPAPDLLAAVPGLGHPDLNPGQRRYLRSTASIYSVDWAWRALRDGHCDLLLHELGKSSGSDENQKKHMDWIYGHHKRLFETDPSIWRKSRPRSVSATARSSSSANRKKQDNSASCDNNNRTGRKSAATSKEQSKQAAAKDRARSASENGNAGGRQTPAKTGGGASAAETKSHRRRPKTASVRRTDSNRDSSSADEGQKDLSKIPY